MGNLRTARKAVRRWFLESPSVTGEEGKINGYHFKVLKITPDVAEMLLAANIQNNRNLANKNVAGLKLAIEEDNWKKTTDGIKLKKDSSMGDGQHRCHAVIQTGKSIIVPVYFGFTDDVILDAMDNNKRRTPADQLAIMIGDRKNNTTRTMMLKYLYFWIVKERELFLQDGTRDVVMNSDLFDLWNMNPKLGQEAAAYGDTNRKLAVSSVLATAYYMMIDSHGENARQYFKQLSGYGLSEGTPADAVIKKLGKLRNDRENPEKARLAVFIAVLKGYSYYISGENKQRYDLYRRKSETIRQILDRVL